MSGRAQSLGSCSEDGRPNGMAADGHREHGLKSALTEKLDGGLNVIYPLMRGLLGVVGFAAILHGGVTGDDPLPIRDPQRTGSMGTRTTTRRRVPVL